MEGGKERELDKNPGIVGLTCNLSTGEAEAGGWPKVQGRGQGYTERFYLQKQVKNIKQDNGEELNEMC